MAKKYAAIDADFFINCVKYQPSQITGDGNLFMKIMDDMGRIPLMHQYVADQEIIDGKAQSVLAALREQGKVKVLGYDDYLPQNERGDYMFAFEQAYLHMTGIRVPKGLDVFCARLAKGSLGELRTFLMAFWLNGKILEGQDANVELLLSNDHGTKDLLTAGIIPENCRICVYNVEETLRHIGKMQARSLRWNEIKILVKCATHAKEELRALFL